MKKKLFMTFYIVALILFISCNKENEEKVGNKDVFIENGIVFFKDIETFKRNMEFLHSNGIDYLPIWEEEIGHVCSYRKMKEYIADTISVNEIMPDPYFSSVLNEYGLFGIGDSVHRITYENEFVSHKNKLNFLLKDDIGLNLDKDIKSFPVLRGFNQPVLKSVVGWEIEEVDKPCNIEKISAHLKCWSVNTLAYASIGIRITGRKYKKRWIGGNWVDDEMNYASVKGIAYFKLNNSQSQSIASGEDSDTNKKNVDVTLTWVATNILHCDSIYAEYYYDHTNEAKENCTQTYIRSWK